MQTIFGLCRILGNEIPPRDQKGGRLAALERLLREPPLPGVVKFWILNRVWDDTLAADYRGLLAGPIAQGHVHEIPFEPAAYFAAASAGQRLCYCPGINYARNEGMRITFEHYGAGFSGVFDGDCGFTQAQWGEVLAGIMRDCVDGFPKASYSVPTIRVAGPDWDRAQADPTPPQARFSEPMLIVSRRAWRSGGIRYNEAKAFGDNDKVDLLVQLGHSDEFVRQHEVVDDAWCRSVGSCYHINTGPDDVECDDRRLIEVRREAVVRMHTDITRRFGSGTI